MKYGITLISIVPCRVEPADAAEQVSQLLFGEHYKVIDERAKWVKVRSAHDKYEGWIDRKQWSPISDTEYQDLDKATLSYSTELVSLVKDNQTEQVIPIVLGSSLPNLENGNLTLAEKSFTLLGDSSLAENISRDQLISNAFVYSNAPYLWGGRSPFGIDCSGFSQLVYKMNGVNLPRDAKDQATMGATLSFIEEALPGDLAFFDNDEGNIIHVGIILADNYIIHASGKVRIDRIDHQGIYNPEIRDYSHKLRIIKQIID